jgi:hypothetical protein
MTPVTGNIFTSGWIYESFIFDLGSALGIIEKSSEFSSYAYIVPYCKIAKKICISIRVNSVPAGD